MQVFYTIAAIIVSAAIGLLMGIIGGGGGGVYVFVLMVLLNMDAKTSAMTALVISTITLSGAAFQYLRKKQFLTDYFIVLSVCDIAGTLAGAAILNFVSEKVLKIVIICVLVLSGLSPLIKMKTSGLAGTGAGKVSDKLPVTVPIGLTSGVITGTTGLSASTMLSSLLIGLDNFQPFLAVGTTTLVSFAGNLVSIVLLFLGGLVFHSTVLHIDVRSLLIFGIGSAAGAVFGAKLTSKINRKILTAVLAAMAVIPAVYLALKR